MCGGLLGATLLEDGEEVLDVVRLGDVGVKALDLVPGLPISSIRDDQRSGWKVVGRMGEKDRQRDFTSRTGARRTTCTCRQSPSCCTHERRTQVRKVASGAAGGRLGRRGGGDERERGQYRHRSLVCAVEATATDPGFGLVLSPSLACLKRP